VHKRKEKTSLKQVAQEALSSNNKVANSIKLNMIINLAKAKEKKRQHLSFTKETITIDVYKTITVFRQ
jgi:hypothetical protein